MSIAHHAVSLALVLATAAGCGKSDKADKAAAGSSSGSAAPIPATATRLPVGAFTVPLLPGWTDVSSERAKAGQVGLEYRGGKGRVLLILSPAPTPMPFDPTDPAACASNGANVPGVVGAPAVEALAAGQACVIQTGGATPSTMVVLAVGDHGVMAQCKYADEADRAACTRVVGGLALAK